MKQSDKIKVIQSIIDLIKSDCSAQYNSLAVMGDLKWNCYDHESWRTLMDLCDAATDHINDLSELQND